MYEARDEDGVTIVRGLGELGRAEVEPSRILHMASTGRDL